MYTRGPAAERASRTPQAVRERKPGARAQRPRPGPALWAGVAEPGRSPSTARRVCLPAEPLLSLRVPAHLCLLVARHAVPEAVEEDRRLRLEDRGAELFAQKVRGNAHRRLRRVDDVPLRQRYVPAGGRQSVTQDLTGSWIPASTPASKLQAKVLINAALVQGKKC